MRIRWLAGTFVLVTAARAEPDAERTVHTTLGRWTGTMVATVPGDKPGRFAWTIDCHVVAGGRGAACEQSGTASIGKIEESCLVAFDPETKAVHKMCVSSAGEVHDHRGAWRDPTTLAFEPLHTTMRGATVTETVTMRFPDATTLVNESVFALPGGATMTFAFTGKKQR
jgi:hypothetical protein